MKYILRHKSGTFQLNLSIDIEEFKKRVRNGKELLTLFDMQGNQWGDKPLTFLDECEITAGSTDNTQQ